MQTSLLLLEKEIHSLFPSVLKDAFIIGHQFMILWTFAETINMGCHP